MRFLAKLIFVLGVIAAATLAHPMGASAHRAVIVGAGPVVVAPPACGAWCFPPAFAPPGFYPWGAPVFGVHPQWRDYRWYYGQYFTPRSERIYGFTLPRRW